MTTFTPWSALLGGALIGAGSAILLLRLGRVAGISGLLAGALFPDGDRERAWRWAFLLGLPIGAALVSVASRGLTVEVDASAGQLVVAGLLVGFGTRLGNGCTSGHGVCGVARGAPRSLTATGVFMSVAIATVFVMRHVIGGAS